MAQVINTDKHRYKRLRVRGPDGVVRYSATANDAVSRALWAMTKEQMVLVVDDNDLGERFHVHSRKNTGHFKMILGGALRERVRKGQTIIIGPHTINSLGQDVPLPAGYLEVPASKVPQAVRIKVRSRR